MSKRKPANLARQLPPALRVKLLEWIGSHGRVTQTLAVEIDSQFAICETYGVTIEQLQSYLRRLRKGFSPVSRTSHEKLGIAAKGEKHMYSQRKRQAEIATVLRQLFGNLADIEPQLWSHRAFLMLMGLAFEKLSTNEHELSTDELVKLTKALGDACRVQPRIRAAASGNTTATHRGTCSLPRNFADIVRQIYGTNISAAVDSNSPTTPPA